MGIYGSGNAYDKNTNAIRITSVGSPDVGYTFGATVNSVANGNSTNTYTVAESGVIEIANFGDFDLEFTINGITLKVPSGYSMEEIFEPFTEVAIVVDDITEYTIITKV